MEMEFKEAARIGVVIRMRPLLPNELSHGHQSSRVKIEKDERQICVQLPRAVKNFKFDNVFEPEAN
jgi:hypothetical protein